MGRARVYHHGLDDQLPPVREPLLTRSLAGALAIGAPIGIVVWLALQQMPTITWAINQVFTHAGQ